MSEPQPSVKPRGKKLWVITIIVGAIILGLGAFHLIPGLLLSQAIGFNTGGVQLVMLLLNLLVMLVTVVALFGLLLSIRNWVRGGKRTPPAAEPRLAKVGRIGAFVTSILFLTAAALLGLLYLHIIVSAHGNGESVGWGTLAVLLLAVSVLPAIALPLLVFQICWAWRPTVARWEHAVLRHQQPGRGRIILATRVLHLIAWVPVTALLIFWSGNIIHTYTPAQQQIQQQRTDSLYYNEGLVEGALRLQLLDGHYIFNDLQCPSMIPNPNQSGTFTCTLSSNGQPRTLHVTWTFGSTGFGQAKAANLVADGVVTVIDLGQKVPTETDAERDYPGDEVTATAKRQLIADGWSQASPLLASISCPGMGEGYGGHVRCQLGGSYLDVYHTGPNQLTVLTAEVRYLRQ